MKQWAYTLITNANISEDLRAICLQALSKATTNSQIEAILEYLEV